MKALAVLTMVLLSASFFHHKPKAKARPTVDPLASPADGYRCLLDGQMFTFSGPDGVVGTSYDSCAAAYRNWQKTPAPYYTVRTQI